MALSRRVWEIPTGIFIRDFLLFHKEGYAYEIWKELCRERKERGIIAPTYRSFWNVWLILQKLGLIRPVRVEMGFGKWARRYFEIVPGTEDYPAWFHPQVAMYPLTQLGGRDYRKLKEKAETERVKPSTYYIRTYPERVEALARELRVSRREIERRIRRT